jgi:excisionase family DNA binding protein
MTPDVSSLSDSAVSSDSKSAEPIQAQSMQRDALSLCPNYVCTPTTPRQRKPLRSTLGRRLVRTREAATYLALSEWKIREVVRDGELPYIDDGKGGPWRFDLRDLDAYVERHRQSGG